MRRQKKSESQLSRDLSEVGEPVESFSEEEEDSPGTSFDDTDHDGEDMGLTASVIAARRRVGAGGGGVTRANSSGVDEDDVLLAFVPDRSDSMSVSVDSVSDMSDSSLARGTGSGSGRSGGVEGYVPGTRVHGKGWSHGHHHHRHGHGRHKHGREGSKEPGGGDGTEHAATTTTTTTAAAAGDVGGGDSGEFGERGERDDGVQLPDSKDPQNSSGASIGSNLPLLGVSDKDLGGTNPGPLPNRTRQQVGSPLSGSPRGLSSRERRRSRAHSQLAHLNSGRRASTSAQSSGSANSTSTRPGGITTTTTPATPTTPTRTTTTPPTRITTKPGRATAASLRPSSATTVGSRGTSGGGSSGGGRYSRTLDSSVGVQSATFIDTDVSDDFEAGESSMRRVPALLSPPDPGESKSAQNSAETSSTDDDTTSLSRNSDNVSVDRVGGGGDDQFDETEPVGVVGTSASASSLPRGRGRRPSLSLPSSRPPSQPFRPASTQGGSMAVASAVDVLVTRKSSTSGRRDQRAVSNVSANSQNSADDVSDAQDRSVGSLSARRRPFQLTHLDEVATGGRTTTPRLTPTMNHDVRLVKTEMPTFGNADFETSIEPRKKEFLAYRLGENLGSFSSALNPYTLHFRDDQLNVGNTRCCDAGPWHFSRLEDFYQTDYVLRSIEHARKTFGLGLALLIVYLAYVTFAKGWIPGCVVGVNVLFGVWLNWTTYQPWFAVWEQTVLAAAIIVTAFINLFVKAITEDIEPNMELMVLIVGAWVHVPLHFFNLAPICIALSIVYQVFLFGVAPGLNLYVLLLIGSTFHIVNIMGMVLCYIAQRTSRRNYWSAHEIDHQRLEVELQREHQAQILNNILPSAIADKILVDPSNQANVSERFDNVAMIFADVVNFTVMSQSISPERLVSLLHDLFQRFDNISKREHVEKIKTIGDCYMVAAGLTSLHDASAHALDPRSPTEKMADMSLAMLTELMVFNSDNGTNIQLRVGIHTGMVVAGVVGTNRFVYDLWGRAVGVAARMEASSQPGCVLVSDHSREFLVNNYDLTFNEFVDLKEGTVGTWWLLGPKQANSPRSAILPRTFTFSAYHTMSFRSEETALDQDSSASRSMVDLAAKLTGVKTSSSNLALTPREEEEESSVCLHESEIEEGDAMITRNPCMSFEIREDEREYTRSVAPVSKRRFIISSSAAVLSLVLPLFFDLLVTGFWWIRVAELVVVIVVFAVGFAITMRVEERGCCMSAQMTYDIFIMTIIAVLTAAYVVWLEKVDDEYSDLLGVPYSLILIYYATSYGSIRTGWALVSGSVVYVVLFCTFLFFKRSHMGPLVGYGVPIILVCLLGVYNKERALRLDFKLSQLLRTKTVALFEEVEQTEDLLLNILPQTVLLRLRDDLNAFAEYFSEATIMFCKIDGIAEIDDCDPVVIVHILNLVFSALEQVCINRGVEKIKTIGPCFMAASGLPERTRDHARRMARAALDMMAAVEGLQRTVNRIVARATKQQNSGEVSDSSRTEDSALDLRNRAGSIGGTGGLLSVRIGINSGSVVAGVIGSLKTSYDLWGDTVNTAARMYSCAPSGKIQLTESTARLLESKSRRFDVRCRGTINVKGKGRMTTYMLEGPRSFPEDVLSTVDTASVHRFVRAQTVPPSASVSEELSDDGGGDAEISEIEARVAAQTTVSGRDSELLDS